MIKFIWVMVCMWVFSVWSIAALIHGKCPVFIPKNYDTKILGNHEAYSHLAAGLKAIFPLFKLILQL